MPVDDADWQGSSSPAVSLLKTPPTLFLPRIHTSPDSPSLLTKGYRHLSWEPQIDDPKVSLPSFRTLFAAPSDDDHPLASEFDPSESSEAEPAGHDEDEDDFTDSDDDRPQHSYFYNAHIRFSTSAERGRWKSDPMPRHAVLRLSARTTSPAPSPAPVQTRNISEPAPTMSPESSPGPQVPLSSSPVLSRASVALSPISLSVSPMVGSVSPLSAAEPLSPLSLPSSSLVAVRDLEMSSDDEKIQSSPETVDGLGLFQATPASPVPSSPILPPAPKPSPSTSVMESGSSAQEVLDVPAVVDASAPNRAKVASHERSRDEPRKVVEAKPLTAADKGKKRAALPVPKEDAPKPKKARIAVAEPESPRHASSSKARSSDRGSRRSDPKAKSSKAAPVSQKPRSKRARALPLPEIDPELCGMLIECLATSRASSMPMSALFKSIMKSYPSVKSRGTEDECLLLMERVLENGTRAAGGSGVFGKVERESNDESGTAFETQWFYMSEHDPDQDRAQLFVSIRPAKRSETKKFKNYFHRPIGNGKMTWDEDAL
uniref:Fork-head domain-containing protein n=1 Tax=Mycena chlorophos TaxID=658473 RepID=A0ABQ0M2G9_MYCCL|nr:predicted protein [Mycena chlorophos]